ncbi:unnamed protein product [Acanthoscelides obtectus]|uniref:HTH psq-type domain-containing protein n=1 Tax=Acanthoscelides obtectus TaxID=200917 RepID=A0A9P0LGJ4_ACAOB|nr:unnamed protein product [Acanthoscelides obtectus]CAK1620860.1 Tigger transposable element-derived protein 4 [Acanthoscelides obtectus]
MFESCKIGCASPEKRLVHNVVGISLWKTTPTERHNGFHGMLAILPIILVIENILVIAALSTLYEVRHGQFQTYCRFMDVIVSVCHVFIISISAERATRAGVEIVSTLYEIQHKIGSFNCQHNNYDIAKNEIMNTIKLILNNRPIFTAAGLFNINAKLLLTLLIQYINRLMALTTLQCILLTFGILGGVHLLIAILQDLEDSNGDSKDVLRDITRQGFMQISKMLPPRKLKTLTIGKKIEILKKVENGARRKIICQEYGIPKSTLSTIMKNKKTIVQFGSEVANPGEVKRNTASKTVNTALIKWFETLRKASLPISGPIAQASSRWLDRFKKRHGILQKKHVVKVLPWTEKCNNWIKDTLPALLTATKQTIFLTQMRLVYFLNVYQAKA